MAIHDRIRQARLLAGLTLEALGARIGVTAQAVSKYELGHDIPSSGVLLRLCDVLERPLEFFLRPIRVGEIQPEFRKHPKLTAREQDVIVARIRDWLEHYLEIESILKLGEAGFVMPEGFPYFVGALEDVEPAAVKLREAWKLGLDPIDDMTELLESQRIKVGVVPAPPGFDACTFCAQVDGGIHVIAVREELPGDRQRFDLAHELGHIVLKPAAEVDREKAAHRFAGAFLVPDSAVRTELGSVRNWINQYELHLLKHKYGLSMSAWIYRAADLGVLNRTRAGQLFGKLKQQMPAGKEPGDPRPTERPRRMERLIMRAVSEDLIAPGRAAELLGVSLEDFASQISRDHDGLTVDLYRGR